MTSNLYQELAARRAKRAYARTARREAAAYALTGILFVAFLIYKLM